MAKKKEAKKGKQPMMTEHVEAAKPEVPETAPPPAAPSRKISMDDLRVLQLAFKEAENAALKYRVAQLEVEKLGNQAEAARGELSRLNVLVNEKYKLNPEKDRINIVDGAIVGGE